jgi:hypothetical protein
MVLKRWATMSVVRPFTRAVAGKPGCALRLGVEGRGGLVEDQDGGVLEEGARDRDPLALTAGQARAALADARGETFRQRLDELEGAGETGRGADLGLRRPFPAEPDVLEDAVVEEHGLLRHQRDVRAEIELADRPEVEPSTVIAPRLRVEEARRQVDEGALAGAAGADQRTDWPAGIANVRSRRTGSAP